MIIKLSLKNVSILILILFTLFTIAIFWNLFILNKESQQCLQLQPQKLSSWNLKQTTKNHLAILVPFRERFNQLLQFIPYMNKFLLKQNISHQFYIINQIDQYRFNRGVLINIGYLLAKNSSSTYIAMHDVDLLPLNDQLSYRYPNDGPVHIASPELHPKYHYKTYVGGILLMTNEQFQLVNGFSTNYFGWGLEDDEFYARLIEAKLQIIRPKNINTNQTNTFKHIHNDNLYKRDTIKLFNQKAITRKRDRKTGLNTTKFSLININEMSIDNILFNVYNVAVDCNIERTPWCLKLSMANKFKKKFKPA